MAADERPSVPMSVEEHGLLSKLTASIEVLAAGQQRTEQTLGKFIEATDGRFSALADRGRFSRGDVYSFIGAAIALAGAVAALLSMRIDAALAPLQTQQQVSIIDRAGLHERQDQTAAAMVSGKEARLEEKSDRRASDAVLTERTNELYYALHGHYPSAH